MNKANNSWFDGTVSTPAGTVPRVRASLNLRDRLGALARTWGIGRSDFAVQPGLYALGTPTPESVVLVSANYKLSFDRLRRELSQIDAWILVLDTKGINVWCAAGKGTFGTDELVRRMEVTAIGKVVSHRKLVLPQLAAPGVSAHEVHKRTGFQVVYGPVRAADIHRFLASGMKADAKMRRVRFSLRDRAAVVPVEIVQGGLYALLLAALFVLLGGLSSDGYRLDLVLSEGVPDAVLILGAFLSGALLTPLMLPFIPGRPFALKGMFAGLLVTLGLWSTLHGIPGAPGILAMTSWLVMGPALASFLAMNFTGASTFTSLSGVKKEMKFAVPAQAVAAVAGIALWAIARFTGH